ncbi:hypothetical protein ACJ72_02834 [Emergomyces africanus]|uniref:Up-regulated during septation protein 1 domain-containing protein n=1 Tax=Emergomyces africanus TaxID=1955775 RepID=A0A1B7P1A8_9EURO|nr:hypothetical protein ACJ72_02834 [Emergomyces africanus]
MVARKTTEVVAHLNYIDYILYNRHLENRVSKFSREGILKQEEALSELDRSIDEWVCKLEHAENRRIRIRQKLLEHMAGAMTLWTPHDAAAAADDDDNAVTNVQTSPRGPRGGRLRQMLTAGR